MLLFSKMAAVAILDFLTFEILTVGRVTVPNFVEIGQTDAEIWRLFSIFQDGGRRHLGFLKF